MVSFCGYAPSDNPQVLVYVVVDEPHVEDQPHSTYASQIFQKIMTEILPYLNVFPDTDTQGSLSSEDAATLPQQEGITTETQPSSESGEAGAETTEQESSKEAPTMENGEKVPDELLNPTEEYVNRQEGEDTDLPAALPGDTDGTPQDTTEGAETQASE